MIEITGTKQREETFGLIAVAWDTAEAGQQIIITQANDRGGKTLEKTLLLHFPDATTDGRNKSRTITLRKTDDGPAIMDEWRAHTKLRLVADTGFYSMPGLFGWDRIDAGSRLLIETLPQLKGVGADFGCGYGYLTKTVLDVPTAIKTLYAFDNDPRAVEACIQNVTDDRMIARTADCTQPISNLPPLDFIISNPPFHNATGEDRGLGQRFIETASKLLRRKGQLWIVANTHMPYEQSLHAHFYTFETVIQKNGFKILLALK